MLPGPTIIRRCSACGKLISQYTIGSGNTFGARFWTDGKREAPMLPDQPSLVLCPHCKGPVWIEELEKVAKIEYGSRGQDPSMLKNTRSYVTPEAKHYFDFLLKGPFDQEKESYLRRRAWWAGNDQRRGEASALPMSNEETANLASFATLLDEADEGNRLMKAEVMRELGRFTEAKALLDHPFSEVDSSAVRAIGSLVEEHDCFVREVSIK